MLDKMANMMKERVITIPGALFYNYKLLNLTEQDFIILIYLINTDDKTFNPASIAASINAELNVVMNSINSLIEQNIIELETINENGIKEIVNTDKLYMKLALLLNNQPKNTKTDIYTLFERELGRTISPTEMAAIGDWEDRYNSEVIEQALKEAIFNGVKNLRYIDSILKNWEDAGIKTKEDVLNHQKKFRSKDKNKPEIIDYDWLNES